MAHHFSYLHISKHLAQVICSTSRALKHKSVTAALINGISYVRYVFYGTFPSSLSFFANRSVFRIQTVLTDVLQDCEDSILVRKALFV